MKTKHLFTREAKSRMREINEYITILQKLQVHQINFKSDRHAIHGYPTEKTYRYLTENERDIGALYCRLMESQHVLRKLLDEENSPYGTSFTGKEWFNIDCQLTINKLIAKYGELNDHATSSNNLDPATYIIRLIDLIAYIPAEVLKYILEGTLGGISVKNEKIISFVSKVFPFLSFYFIYDPFDNRALFYKIVSIFN